MTEPTVTVSIQMQLGVEPSVRVSVQGVPEGLPKEAIELLLQTGRQVYATMTPHVKGMVEHASKTSPALVSSAPPADGPDPSGFDLSKCPDHPDRTSKSKKGPGFYCTRKNCTWSTTLYEDSGLKKWKLDGVWLEREEYITALRAPRTPQTAQSAVGGSDAW